MDADVIIVGAGPTGLMLAGELRLAGVRPLVLERQPQIRDIPKAGGLSGQILQLLRYRGELERFEQPLRRIGALIAGSDIRYPLPGHDHHALIGTFAPDLALHTDRGATSVAELMHSARPILLDLADRPDLRETARDWQHRVDIHTAKADHRPADALLIRPDAHIAWAATIDEPADTAALALREALRLVRYTPKSTMPIIDQPS